MVWHTHMLNPRAFLEDAMLSGLRRFWVTGMPWDLINKAIDTDFNYTVSDGCKARWTQQTGLAWDNVDGRLTRTIRCPRCNGRVRIPWTTCGRAEDYQDPEPPVLTGTGYGDSNLEHLCTACGTVIRRELLSVANFVADTKALLGSMNRPMPGTVLDPKTGTPAGPLMQGRVVRKAAHSFPNRLLKSGCNSIRSRITELMSSGATPDPTMALVRREIEAVLAERTNIRQIDGVSTVGRYALPAESRIAIRKMMSRYWQNCSMFAVELCGAVMRQGIFVEKMCKLDWLHSPSARATMVRLLHKYVRFIEIMRKRPNQIVVPTLDVDLAWHTHQLSPSRYYMYTVAKTGRFIDHDDKIDENTLSKQFEWTSKVYQELYGEVYSACTCWYCEGT
jgi:hypothetical protein